MARSLDRARGLLAGTDDVALRPLRTGDSGWVLSRHGYLYAEEQGYDQRFEGVVASILAGFLERKDPREAGWIAHRGSEDGEERLGCCFVMAEPDEPRSAACGWCWSNRMRAVSAWDNAFSTTAIDWSRAAGYERMVLWTHESHHAAGRLYARNGFALLSSQAARAYGQEVVDQTWRATYDAGHHALWEKQGSIVCSNKSVSGNLAGLSSGVFGHLQGSSRAGPWRRTAPCCRSTGSGRRFVSWRCRLAIDAKNESVAPWYGHFGARELLDDPLHLILPLATIAAVLSGLRS